MDENIVAITNFLKADNGIKEQIGHNFDSYGNEMFEETSKEVVRFLQTKGFHRELTPAQIQSVIRKTFGFGVERFMAEYERGTLTDQDLVNDNFEIGEEQYDRAMYRRKHIHGTIGELETRGGHKCSYFGDFSNRAYEGIRETILDIYGPQAARDYEYFGYYDVRDILQSGLNMTLNKIHDRTMGLEDMYHLENGVKGLEEVANASRVAYRESLAAQFK